MNIKKMNTRKAFTLVEMLIVVVIIGILASALIPRLTGAQARARDTARIGHMNQISTALQTYFSEEGVYPGNGCTSDLGSGSNSIVPTFIKNIPSDPQSKRKVKFGQNGPRSGSGSKVCTKDGSYGVLPIYRNGADGGGVVLAANTETEGGNSNFVLAGSGNKGTVELYDGSDAFGSCDPSTDPSKCFTTDIEATTLDEAICSDGVNLSDNAGGCGNSKEGSASINTEMIHIVTK